MTKNKFLFLFVTLLIASLSAISSCKKEEMENEDEHHTSATITISSPTVSATYYNSDTVKINATIVADETLHGYDIYIRNKADNSLVFTTDAHVHNASITIDTFWVNTLSGDTTDLEVEISTAIDHDGNLQGKKVAIKCLP